MLHTPLYIFGFAVARLRLQKYKIKEQEMIKNIFFNSNVATKNRFFFKIIIGSLPQPFEDEYHINNI